jgi:uncharacterized protein YceH (UPF0502 family)
VHDTLERLIGRGHVVDEGRRPGQKETRFAQTLSGGAASDGPAPEPVTAAAAEIGDRVDRLEGELRALRRELDELRAALGEG